MKKAIKIALVICVVSLIMFLGTIIYFLAVTSNYKLDDKKLVNLDRTAVFYDINGNEISKSDSENDVTNIENIPSHVIDAFIAIEDKRFYKHNGVDVKGLFRATFNNIKSFSFKEGASTISQQLIKNTHLTSEKTLNRKFIEMKLSLDLERNYSKNEIIEKYLNTIYFGDNCFGITKASRHYFDKEPKELSVVEGAALAGLIKSPSYYSPSGHKDNCNKRKNLVLNEMFKQGYLEKNEYEIYKNTVVTAKIKETFTEIGFMDLAKRQLGQNIENGVNFSENLNIYTAFLPNMQDILEKVITENTGDFLIKAIVIDKNSNVNAYFANCVDYRRQLGSTIKPLISYAPAIEMDLVDSFSVLRDEKTNFGEYSPSNYNDVYYGDVSVKNALSKSSNVCAVKLLNYVGVENAKKYLKNLDLPLSEGDNSLTMALGVTENGATLRELVQAYSIFLNDGVYKSCNFVSKITNKHGRIINKQDKTVRKVFSADTTCLINDMLNETTKSGTAKRLSFSGVDLCAKTGTVGGKNGNTDAYCISFNSDHIVCVWLGNKEGKLLSNDITGGGLPCEIAKEIWKRYYANDIPPAPFNLSLGVKEIELDKLSYENSVIEIADKISPKRYALPVLIKKSRMPLSVSTRFSSPKIEKPKMSVNNKRISFELCHVELYDIRVFRSCNGKKQVIYDSRLDGKKNLITDMPLLSGEYIYSVSPYYYDGEKEYVGKEIKMPKIKISTENIGGDWWKEFL